MGTYSIKFTSLQNEEEDSNIPLDLAEPEELERIVAAIASRLEQRILLPLPSLDELGDEAIAFHQQGLSFSSGIADPEIDSVLKEWHTSVELEKEKMKSSKSSLS